MPIKESIMKTYMCYLIFSESGIKRQTRNKPSLKAGEYAVQVKLNLPKGFLNRAFPVASVTIPENAIVEPEVEVSVVKETKPKQKKKG